MTSPSMLLSLDRPSPAAAAAATPPLLVVVLDVAAGDEEEEEEPPVPMDSVVVTGGPKSDSVGADASSAVVEEPAAVPLAGDSLMVTVKFAGLVDAAEVLGRVQVVVVDEEQSVAWAACWAGLLGRVSCAWARVVAPRATRIWEGRIG